MVYPTTLENQFGFLMVTDLQEKEICCPVQSALVLRVDPEVAWTRESSGGIEKLGAMMFYTGR